MFRLSCLVHHYSWYWAGMLMDVNASRPFQLYICKVVFYFVLKVICSCEDFLFCNVIILKLELLVSLLEIGMHFIMYL